MVLKSYIFPDFHCGSFDNKKKFSYGIDLINQQNADIILFLETWLIILQMKFYPGKN